MNKIKKILKGKKKKSADSAGNETNQSSNRGKHKSISKGKRKSKATSRRRKTNKKTDKEAKRIKKKSKGFSTNLASWVILFLCCSLYGIIVGLKFQEFDEYTQKVADNIDSIEFKQGEVLGLDDVEDVEDDISPEVELSESSSGDSEESEIVAQNPDDSDSEETEDEEGDGEVDLLVDDIEEERKQELREKLMLQLPREIDNPNYPVTFVQPGDEKVEVQIDGDGFEEVESPFLLPSLGIGIHKINFRFEDEDEITQNFEEVIIVIPRAPEFGETQKKKFRTDENLMFSGTGLPNSEVVLVVGENLALGSGSVDSEGNWSVEMDLEIDKGDYSIIAMTRKLGYASNFSEPFSFSVGNAGGEVETDIEDSANDNFDLNLNDLITEDNYQYVYGGFAAVVLLILGLFTILGSKASRMKKENRDLKGALLRSVKTDNEDDDGYDELSLREKFARAGLKVGGSTPEMSSDAKDSKSDSESSASDLKKKAADISETNSDSDSKTEPESGSESEPELESEAGPEGSDSKSPKSDSDKKSTSKKLKDKEEKDSQTSPDSQKSQSQKKKEKTKDERKDSDEDDQLSGKNKKRHKNKNQEKNTEKTSKSKSETKKSNRPRPVPGRIYKKSDFLEKFDPEKTQDSNQISITLTSKNDEDDDKDKDKDDDKDEGSSD